MALVLAQCTGFYIFLVSCQHAKSGIFTLKSECRVSLENSKPHGAPQPAEQQLAGAEKLMPLSVGHEVPCLPPSNLGAFLSPITLTPALRPAFHDGEQSQKIPGWGPPVMRV